MRRCAGFFALLIAAALLVSACPGKKMDRDERHERMERSGGSRY